MRVTGALGLPTAPEEPLVVAVLPDVVALPDVALEAEVAADVAELEEPDDEPQAASAIGRATAIGIKRFKEFTFLMVRYALHGSARAADLAHAPSDYLRDSNRET